MVVQVRLGQGSRIGQPEGGSRSCAHQVAEQRGDITHRRLIMACYIVKHLLICMRTIVRAKRQSLQMLVLVVVQVIS